MLAWNQPDVESTDTDPPNFEGRSDWHFFEKARQTIGIVLVKKKDLVTMPPQRRLLGN